VLNGSSDPLPLFASRAGGPQSRSCSRTTIIEFKPDTNSESFAREQAAKYLDDVKRKFKDDDRAKKCKQKDGYPDFTPVCETYPACRS